MEVPEPNTPVETGNPYAAPKTTGAPSVPPVVGLTPFFPTAIWKLIVLYTASLGTYTLYWFYQHWKRARNSMPRPIMPFWRAVFYIFFTHSLFQLVSDHARARGLITRWPAGLLATIFVLLQIVERIVDRITAKSEQFGTLDFVGFGLMFAGLIPLIVVQATANQVNGDPGGRLNETLTGANLIVILIGLTIWALIVITAFFPAVLA